MALLQREGIIYEPQKRPEDAEKSTACAKKLQAARTKSIQLSRMISNAELLQQRLEDTACHVSLAGVLQRTHLTMDALVRRALSLLFFPIGVALTKKHKGTAS